MKRSRHAEGPQADESVIPRPIAAIAILADVCAGAADDKAMLG